MLMHVYKSLARLRKASKMLAAQVRELLKRLFAGNNVNALALLHDVPSDATITAAGPDGCVVAYLERRELQESLGNAELLLNRLGLLCRLMQLCVGWSR